jgi:ArsR family transcriptional regulator
MKGDSNQLPISGGDSCAVLLKVLADGTRLAVLRLLMDGPRHVGELNQQLQLEQSLLSHHLRVLREHKLVVARRDGKAVLYHLAPGARVAADREGIDLGCCRLTFEAGE